MHRSRISTDGSVPEIKKLEDFLADISHKRQEGKAKVVAAQKSAAGKEVVVEGDD